MFFPPLSPLSFLSSSSSFSSVTSLPCCCAAVSVATAGIIEAVGCGVGCGCGIAVFGPVVELATYVIASCQAEVTSFVSA